MGDIGGPVQVYQTGLEGVKDTARYSGILGGHCHCQGTFPISEVFPMPVEQNQAEVT